MENEGYGLTMAKDTSVLKWCLDNTKKFNFTIKEIQSTPKFLPGYHDYLVKIFFNNETFYGRGIDSHETTALVKAFAELFERIVMFDSEFPNSNGIACHTDIKKAQENAKREMIERDSFFCHYLNRISFKKEIKIFSTKIKESIHQLEKVYKSDTNVYLMDNSLGYYNVLCLAKGHRCQHPFSYILGASSHLDLEKAITKAYSEVLINVVSSQHNLYKIPDFKDNYTDVNRITDHGHAALKPEFDKYNSLEFISNDNFKIYESLPVTTNFSYQKITAPDYLKDTPFIFVKASSKNVQEAIVGNNILNQINTMRINKNNTINNIIQNYKVHPFG